MFNEIDGDFDDVAINTFKVGLPAKHGLRKSLTGKPVISVRQLMDQIDKYKRVDPSGEEGFQVELIQQQPTSEGLCWAVRVYQCSGD